VKNTEIESLKLSAIKEVDEFRDKAQQEIDSIRFRMFDERDRIVLMLRAMKDSHQVIRDNLTIKPDSNWISGAEVIFDEETGKPKLIFK